jgi:hypothetical protein
MMQVAGTGLNTSQALYEIFTTMRRKPNNINPSREILGRQWAGNGPIGPKRIEKSTFMKFSKGLSEADL